MIERIRVVGGPWPERHGCVGEVLPAPPGPDGHRYPWAGLSRGVVVVRLDDDPIRFGGEVEPAALRGWSCVIDRRHLVSEVEDVLAFDAPAQVEDVAEL